MGATIAILTREKTDEAIHNVQSKHGLDNVFLKNLVSALSMLFYEAAKHNATPSELSSAVEDWIALPTNRVELLCDAYSVKVQQLRVVLSAGGFRLPYLHDVEWRVDHVYGGKESGKPSIPQYTLNFDLEKQTNEHQHLRLHCTLESMQDIVAKLQDMVKQAERIGEVQ
eukprot:NODE_4907_length_617_cov_254.133803_g4224_i0.p1 GENE.NODE_4907_length_617_cov_254.133803_g4224_i0~~NODE_4907_length_617_cov_254.133803_g4224_i0.p1  ORF type:complete len:177 (-),score=45.35 NODE_4907_length_617_cov_254.133803_g4224_i0:87-593(-)